MTYCKDCKHYVPQNWAGGGDCRRPVGIDPITGEEENLGASVYRERAPNRPAGWFRKATDRCGPEALYFEVIKVEF